MKNKYELPEQVRWYQTLWEMRNHEFRTTFLTTKRRHWRMFWKYESHLVYERVIMGFIVASCMFFMSNLDLTAAVFRLPTEDVNELLKQDVWRKYRSEINERKEHASKMLEDSSYIHNKNKPYST
ncbi:hypothetical protein C3747_53g565c [Trypanosoma cruzi]|uniref:Uncharacterized protein n=2 Tax=Trypanosoma cruzi TaxID=5693 RepID=Q4DEX1_TRYCC|nr:hypothetical protein, conserved [Trypanosoma cruzi]EAN91074.1 hypothetical protein, conserved [Trypanosoma cruzi]KAF8285892.1 hypothetical protein TcYC6_0032620 [Trypanosoma cruzi]PWV12243.1 hypothetical protein C3747_53g565c [Trypanosoma cruzi]|eukprot:XP_812925.1 hypothetical protein [Trypanosoma cruzi strain CL Brener]